MNTFASRFVMVAAAGMAGTAWAQGTRPAARPVATPPASSSLHVALPVHSAPLGGQANFTFGTIATHRTELGVTGEQMTRIEAAFHAGVASRPKQSELQDALGHQIREALEADDVDLPRVETLVRQYEEGKAEAIIADLRLNASLKGMLSAEQRSRLKELSGSSLPFPAPKPPAPSPVRNP